MVFNKESDFEEALIKILSEKGWEKEVLKNYSEKDLLQNWANILFENNRDIDRLNDYPLTDSEMQQILEQIETLRTPLKLNGFINGRSVSIVRDNPDDKLHFGKEISLKIYDRREIAAWQLIFDVCRVTGGDPVNEWKAHLDRLTSLGEKMNALDLESVHFESANGTDLTVGLAEKASWESAGSKNEKGVFFLPNIPTEEVFTAPHKDKVDGIVYGTKPYVFNGQLIKGFHVTFKDGKVVEHGAEEGADLLGRLLDTDEGARHIGEVALVPASSPINRSGALFYSTLFDENAACHIAFGASYPGTTEGGTGLTKEQLEERGMNQSTIHEDVMIGAEDSHITGKCRDGRAL